MFINSRLLDQQQVAETVSGKQLIRLEKQKKNPYFTRVDFVCDGEQIAEKNIYRLFFIFDEGRETVDL